MAATTTASSATTTSASAAATAGVEAYEDMFKEITRKLYGAETGHGLHGTPIAQVATGGHLTLPEGERSFTTLISDRAGNSLEFPNDLNANSSKDHLFGLAALMQNGFTQPPSSILAGHNFSPNAVAGSPSLTSEDVARWNATGVANVPDNCADILPWNVSQPSTNADKPTSSKATKKEGDHKRVSQDHSANGVHSGSKRYTCGSCPYSTDRRDLHSRHSNIHKTEKPFFCYVCLKQFNRADHVKKHFLRMHRELQYDINKTRRSVPGRAPSVLPAAPAEPPLTAAASAALPATLQTTTADYYGLGQPTNNYRHASEDNELAAPCMLGNANGSELGLLTNSPHLAIHPRSSVHAAVPVEPPVKVKQEKTSAAAATNSPPKKKGDKRFMCCYCPWTGADNWGLKRHLNTHTKPYVCVLCDYKAARPERLVTHVYKVHNKKACNKCSFLADDHAQFLAHQAEAHPMDSRPGQGGNGNHNNSHQESVLRAIGNTTNSTTTSNDPNGVVEAMQLFGNGYNSGGPAQAWRPAAASQKRGAERLFQYMEADGSDPEDYHKQLQMTALSRSGRSTVAQDFHSAGGGVMMTTTSTKQQEASTSLFANKGYQQTFIRDLEEFIVQRLITGSHDGTGSANGGRNKSISAINTPPPAKQQRRRCSSHDKENMNMGQKTQMAKATDRGQINAQMRDIFHMMAQHYERAADRKRAADSESLELDLERILKNNHELTISIKDSTAPKALPCIKYNNGDSGLDDEEEEDNEDNESPANDCCQKRKRKQFVPRKIDSTRNNVVIWNGIRDKHLSRLMSSKKSCRICVQRQSSLSSPHHSVASLILHKKYRHWKPLKSCNQCNAQFKLPYQLHLHQRFNHRSP